MYLFNMVQSSYIVKRLLIMMEKTRKITGNVIKLWVSLR